MSATWEQAQIKAASQAGFDPMWASQDAHARDCWPVDSRSRSRCNCGCGKRSTHVGGCNGMGLRSGCELSIRRWMREGVR